MHPLGLLFAAPLFFCPPLIPGGLSGLFPVNLGLGVVLVISVVGGWFIPIIFCWALLAGQKRLAAWVACLVATSAVLAVVWPDPASYRIRFCGRLMDQFGDPVPKATLKFKSLSQGGPQFRAPFGYGAGPFTVRTNRAGFFRVSVHARDLYFEGVQCPPRYETDLLGRQKRGPGVVYYYVRRYFPADVICTGKGKPLDRDCSRGAFDYTYFDSWYPCYETAPRWVRKQVCHDHFLESGKRQGGDLWLSTELAPDSMHAVVRVVVPGGGVVLQSDPGTVIAPETGYQDVLEVTLAFRARPGANLWDQPRVRFFARRERYGEVFYSLYELVGERMSIGDGNVGFYPYLIQRTNPYGSRNLELSDENSRESGLRDVRAEVEFDNRLFEIEKTQGEAAAEACLRQRNAETEARQKKQLAERRERSKTILPEVLALEERRLVYKPAMEAVLAGQPHPPWPRAGIKGGPNDIPPDYTLWLILLATLGLAGVGAVLVVRRRRRGLPGAPAASPEMAPADAAPPAKRDAGQ